MRWLVPENILTQIKAAAPSLAAILNNPAVHVDGYWLNCPGPGPDIGKACEFLRLMTGGKP